ncbi:MAG: hypothetical protein IJE43_06830 [Alphaproteobacteria bacterium]|nr:hypothetical protein [Alphaproteobacteria bacterium]MBQ3196991.1 hypothetical protein [Alistipes sp.]
MKIKSVENFSLEECREYLNTNPDGTERSAVEDRLDAILHQKRYCEEQKEKQRKLEQERLIKDVKWIDIKQFLSNHKYRKLSGAKIIVWVPLLIAVFILSASIYFSNTTHKMYDNDRWVQANYTTGIECLLLQMYCINPRYWYEDEYPRYDSYYIRGEALATLGVIIPAILILIIIHFLSSPSLPSIYNIEQEEKTKSVRRTQNRAGKFGLHLCKKRRIIQLLPMEYDNIYHCGGNAYICVRGNKSGVYNTQAKKMVINIEYDSIEIAQNGALIVSKNGVHSKLTPDGYRIIE